MLSALLLVVATEGERRFTRENNLAEGKGACLTWSKDDGGKVYQFYTKTGKAEVEGALACFVAAKPVSGFKFHPNNRRSVIKNGKKLDGTLEVYPNDDDNTGVYLALLQDDGIVKIVTPGHPVPLKGVQAVGAFSPQVNALSVTEGQKLALSSFMAKGRTDAKGFTLSL